MNLFDRMFFRSPSVDFSALIKNGATILDVRIKREYETGNIPGSINIPLDHLSTEFYRLPDKSMVIIICCASGLRSAAVKKMLTAHGYLNVHDGGNWKNLLNHANGNTRV
jgi:phage shock protein E